MSNYWKIQGVPHKGWKLRTVIDVREEGQSEWEADYETCMMCGNERIRYVHIVSHDEIDEDYRVGCVCAEKMTNDYITPRRLEKELRNRASRLINWSKKQWKRSQNGNHYLKYEDHHLLIYKDKKSNKFKAKVGETFGKKTFETLEQAKIAVLKGIEYLKEKGEW